MIGLKVSERREGGREREREKKEKKREKKRKEKILLISKVNKLKSYVTK